MITAPFEYHAPGSLPEALKLLNDLGDEAKLLAGGHSLLPMMKLRFAEPAHLIDLGRIETLRGITQVGDEIHIGAMTTEEEIVNSEILANKVPLLVEGARLIADPQVRSKGTIGGDISHGDPGNDHPALMMALDATFVIAGPQGERLVEADGYFLGLYMTLLEPGEILVQIRIPVTSPRAGVSYQKLKRKTGDYATAATAVVLEMNGDVVGDVRIALTNAAPTALRAKAAEEYLRGKPINSESLAEASRLAMSICDPMADLRGDEEYKRAMSGEMTRRALQVAHERAGNR